MTPENWQKIKSIFNSALELPKNERRDFIEKESADEESVKNEVFDLLNSHEEDEDFIENNCYTTVKHIVIDEKPNFIGETIGRYQIESKIGSGGMGTVYLGKRIDGEFEQKVAVKLIKLGLDSEDTIFRFRHERQILAGLSHPNIAHLIDGGVTKTGLPYLIMDYVEGLSLKDYCDAHKLSLKARLKLFIRICSAISYAHQNLVIHRDIKPSNILITPDGLPKLLDFGIAKLIESEENEQNGGQTLTTRAMTPEYASPEQILGKSVSTTTDIYSLGVVLYELLTGHRPFLFRKKIAGEISKTITETLPPKPSFLCKTKGLNISVENPLAAVRNLQGDLDNIVLMAIRKEPERRYSSVEQFALDIGRYLDGLPVLAQQDTFIYRAGKFIKRHQTEVIAGTGILVSLLAGISATNRQAKNARRQRDKAEKVNDFLKQMLNSADPRIQGKDVTMVEVLNLANDGLEKDLVDQPIIDADLRSTIGLTYLSLGHHDLAEIQLKKALEIRLEVLEGRHADIAVSLYNFGKLLQAKGDFFQAETYFREALTILKKYHPNLKKEIASILNNLGYVVLLKNEKEESANIYRQEVKIRKELNGENHPEYALALIGVADVYVFKGEKHKALLIFQKSLSIFRQYYKTEHLDIATGLLRIAGLIQYEDSKEAKKLLAESLEIKKRLLGNEHPETAWVYYNFANLAHHQKEYEEALFYCDKILKNRKNILDEHPVISSTLFLLGDSLTAIGKPELAEPFLNECVELRQKTLSSDHWLIASAVSVLGNCLSHLGKFIEAEKMLVESHRILQKNFGNDSEHTERAAKRLGAFYQLLNTNTSDSF